MRFKMTLSYDGAAFCGWQIQPRDPSVQGTLQEKLSLLLGQPVEVVGAGRTDTAVNARGYVAHFDFASPVDTDSLGYKLNSILPPQIAVHSIERADDDFHARFSAVSRRYRYYIHREKDPFANSHSWYCRFKLDVGKMNEACAYLLGTHDFKCFEKTGSDAGTSVCTVTGASWEITGMTRDGDYTSLVFTISANRFLRNMVRAIVGTMIEIGRGNRPPQWILQLLEDGSRSDAGQSVPGHALFLDGIVY